MTTLSESRAWVREFVCEALSVAGIKHDAAASMCGVPPGRFSKQLAGVGKEHLSLQRLVLIPDQVFWFVFLTRVRERMQVVDTTSPEIAYAVQQLLESVAKHVSVRQLRMAKASLPEGQQERRRSA